MNEEDPIRTTQLTYNSSLNSDFEGRNSLALSQTSRTLTLKTDTPDNLLLAERIRDTVKERKTLIKGSLKTYKILKEYKKYAKFRASLLILSIISLIMKKPAWCESNPEMSVKKYFFTFLG